MTPEQQAVQDQIDMLKRDIKSLQDSFYLNNFPSSQDFNKTCRFNSRIKVPHYSAAPTVDDVGELIEVGGVLYISTAVDTWTVVGTQT
jgi:hypothetical protein